MKKTVLFFAGMLLMGVSVSFAQSDTTASPAQRQQPTQQSDNARQNDVNQNYTKDMVKVQQTDLPQTFQQTLQGTQYKGWENGTFYRSKTGDAYLLEMKDGKQTTIHRFDANGRPLTQ